MGSPDHGESRTMKRYLKGSWAPLASVGLVAALATPAMADDGDLLDKLLERGVLTQEDVDELRASDEPVERFPGLNYEPTTPIEDVRTRTRVNRFRVETEDGKHRFGVRGRLMTDWAHVADNLDTTDNEDAGDGDLAKYGTILRRARLGALGVMYDNWEWQLEVDFRDDEIRFANAYMAYLTETGRFAVGHFKEPFSLESSTSSRRISFIERATPVDAYRPSREIGLMYETIVPRWYAAAGIFGGDGVERNRDVSEGFSLAGRASFAPMLSEDNRNWSHLGLSANYRSNAKELDEGERELEDVRMRSRLGTRAVDGRIIGRRDMEAVEDWTTFALEGAFGVGPFSLQGEYIRQELNRDKDDPNFDEGQVDSMTMDGWYLQASYFLTGESRNYRAFSGDFGRTEINRPFNPRAGSYGAWELLARYAYADHRDHHDLRGQQEVSHYTLGLNWYLQPEIMVKLNAMYIDAEVGSEDFASGVKDWDSWVYAARFQFEF